MIKVESIVVNHLMSAAHSRLQGFGAVVVGNVR